MQRLTLLFFIAFFQLPLFAQHMPDLVKQVHLDSLVKTVREFSGEDSVIVDTTKVRIKHRISNAGNNLAATYLKQRLEAYGFTVQEVNYRAKGRNIIAVKKGILNPDSIYVMGAHYDAVADYCADDNASGCASLLEAARIMSNYCFANTVVFAFWDEEELGLIGSKYHADSAAARGDRILGVINNDMLGYDSDSNHVFDIHADTLDYNLQMKDTLLYVLNTLGLNLTPQVIIPGTTRSDHASFWRKGYPAIYFGESFLGGDPNPQYHKSTDRINLFNLAYFYELAKLGVGTMVELAGIIPTAIKLDTVMACKFYTYQGDTFTQTTTRTYHYTSAMGCDSTYALHVIIDNLNDSIYSTGRELIAYEQNASYQWLKCPTYEPIAGANSQKYWVQTDGSYAVEIKKGVCKDTSLCVQRMVSYVPTSSFKQVNIYPNPSEGQLFLEFATPQEKVYITLYSLLGKVVYQHSATHIIKTEIDLTAFKGYYYISLQSDNYKTNKLIHLK